MQIKRLNSTLLSNINFNSILLCIMSNSVLVFQDSEWISVVKAEFGFFPPPLKYKVWELTIYAKPILLLIFNND